MGTGSPVLSCACKPACAETDEEEEELPEGEKRPPYNAKLMPEFIFSIDAPDEFLRARIMALPEAVVHGTHNTEEGFQRRLNDFRTINTDEDTVLNYFDELEVHPIRIGTCLVSLVITSESITDYLLKHSLRKSFSCMQCSRGGVRCSLVQRYRTTSR